MSEDFSVLCPAAVEYLFFHRWGERGMLELEEARKRINEFTESLEMGLNLQYGDEEYSIECNIYPIEPPKKIEKEMDFYFLMVVVDFEKETVLFDNPFSKFQINLFEKLEEKCKKISNDFIQTLNVEPYGRGLLLSSKSTERTGIETIREDVFSGNSLKGDSYGDAFIYRGVNDWNRFFLDIPFDDENRARKLEETLVKNLGAILAYYKKLELFYTDYHGTSNKKGIGDRLQDRKTGLRDLLEDLNDKIGSEEGEISSSELGTKNKEISSELTELARLNHLLKQKVNSINADIFNLQRYINHLNHDKIEGMSSIFGEMKKLGDATLTTYKDSLEDMRYLQEFLKLDSDIIQNQLEVEESRFNSFLQIAAFIVGGGMLFEAVIETLLYVYSEPRFYALSSYMRILHTTLIVILIAILGIWYGRKRKGKIMQ